MAWRYRRSTSFGPFRITASNSGLGFSFGGPLGRVSVNTRGQVRQTTRIPGLGLYQTQKIGQIGGNHQPSKSIARQSPTYPHVTAALPVARAGAFPAYELATPRSRAKAIATTIALVTIETVVVLFLIGLAGSSKTADWVSAALVGLLAVALFFTIRAGRTPKPAARNIVTPPTQVATTSRPVSQTQTLATSHNTASTPTPPELSDSQASTAGVITLPGQIAVSAFDATGGVVELDPLKPGVVSIKVVDIKTSPATVARYINLPVGADGLRHGVHEGLLIPTGTEWRAYCLIHSDDHSEPFDHDEAGAVGSLQVGRLSIRDVRTYAPLFAGHPVQISLFIEATAGLEHFEIRFLDRPATPHEDHVLTAPAPARTITPAASHQVLKPTSATTTTPEALPAANWFTDPTNPQLWRWWDGASWTTYTAPK